MNIFIKVTAAILLTSIINIVLERNGKDISILLTMAVCCMAVAAAVSCFTPVFRFVNRLVEIGGLNHELINILLKVVGIGLVSQIAGFVCADAGSQSLAKAMQIMTVAVILCISVPALEEMLSLIEGILEEV